jgi:hypothetical protein
MYSTSEKSYSEMVGRKNNSMTSKYLWEKDSIRNIGEKGTVIPELTLKY